MTAPPVKSPGQLDYEADCAKTPNYHDGRPRKHWAELGRTAQWSWERKHLSPP